MLNCSEFFLDIYTTSSGIVDYFNSPSPSCFKPLFQSEAKCEAIGLKMIFNFHARKTHFHNKGFAVSLILKMRILELRKVHCHKYEAHFSRLGYL